MTEFFFSRERKLELMETNVRRRPACDAIIFSALPGIRSYFDNSGVERQSRAKTPKSNVAADRMISEGYRMSTSLGVDHELALRKAELRRKALALIAMVRKFSSLSECVVHWRK